MSGKTLLEIAQDVAVEIRYPKVIQVFGNSDRNVISIFDAIKKGAERDIYRAHNWSEMLELFESSGTGDTDNIVNVALPEDFKFFLPETAWDTLRDRPAIGGLSDVEWNGMMYGDTNAYTNNLFYRTRRVVSGTTYSTALQIAKVSSSESYEFKCNYKRKWFVTDPTTGQAKESWTADTDTTILDSELVSLAATVRMLRELGRSFGDQQAELTALIKDARRKDGSKTHSLLMDNPGPRDHLNIPGYPLPINRVRGPGGWRY